MVHTALAKIKTDKDIEQALNSMFLGGLITEEERNNLTPIISKIIALPELNPHFAPGLTIKNEAEIVSLLGEKFRLDRVVLNSNKTAVIIDYKTGEEKPEHKKQILKYTELLEQMGYAVIEKLLVYIEKEKVINVY
jgi:RecB family exonuclease